MKLDDDNWHCLTVSRRDPKTGKFSMEKVPVYHEISDDAIASCGFRSGGCARDTWETKNGRCITRVVGKEVGSFLIKIPRPHDVKA